jgi:hypothetical protein
MNRPNWWWLQQGDIHVGGDFDLNLPEVAIIGRAKIVQIQPTKADSRKLRPGETLVISRFIHDGAKLFELVFEDGKSQQTTPNHPFRSMDRKAWIQAGELRPGERIATLSGSLKLRETRYVPGLHKVYNLETHQDHTFFIGEMGAWVHNSYDPNNNLNWVLEIPKGSRPHPATYLGVSERKALEAMFNEGAVRFTSRKSIERYGTAGSSDAFVFPRSYFDEVVSEAKGNLRIIEKRLGLESGYLGDVDTVAAYISRSDFSRMRIPSGNEAGANLFWLPGGRTSGGVPEMILDLKKTPFSIIEFR